MEQQPQLSGIRSLSALRGRLRHLHIVQDGPLQKAVLLLQAGCAQAGGSKVAGAAAAHRKGCIPNGPAALEARRHAVQVGQMPSS